MTTAGSPVRRTMKNVRTSTHATATADWPRRARMYAPMHPGRELSRGLLAHHDVERDVAQGFVGPGRVPLDTLSHSLKVPDLPEEQGWGIRLHRPGQTGIRTLAL